MIYKFEILNYLLFSLIYKFIILNYMYVSLICKFVILNYPLFSLIYKFVILNYIYVSLINRFNILNYTLLIKISIESLKCKIPTANILTGFQRIKFHVPVIILIVNSGKCLEIIIDAVTFSAKERNRFRRIFLQCRNIWNVLENVCFHIC